MMFNTLRNYYLVALADLRYQGVEVLLWRVMVKAFSPLLRLDLQILFDFDLQQALATRSPKVALVITQGHWLAPKALHEELGIVPFVSSTPPVRELPKPARTSMAGASAGHRH